MNPSYVRIRLPLADAMARYSAWVAVAAVGPAVEVSLADAVRLACDEHGRWLGSALFVYHCDGWTVFEDPVGSRAATGMEAGGGGVDGRDAGRTVGPAHVRGPSAG